MLTITDAPKLGSLFTGAAGLDVAVEAVFGTTTAWHCETDPAASRVLAHRFPGVPNLGDVTAVDWTRVEPVDVICGGSPCQDVSSAGKRAGMRAGTRSGLWASMCDAIDVLRPRYVVWENVRGVLSAEADSALEPCAGCVGDGDDGPVLRALGRVLGDLADLGGYDVRWCGLRAADVGAPHGRFRVFVVAHAQDIEQGVAAAVDDAAVVGSSVGASPRDHAGRVAAGIRDVGRGASVVAADPGSGSLARAAAAGHGLRVPADRGDRPATDPDDARREGREPAWRRDVPDRRTPADATRNGRHEGRPEPAGIVGGPDAAERGATTADADRDGREGLRWLKPIGCDTGRRGGTYTAWGQYEPAIQRWERVLGRLAPAPTEPGLKGGQRLSPRFVEWMMGWPGGWVTDVPGVTRNDALRICGNGVVPQQAAEALRRMVAHLEERAA